MSFSSSYKICWWILLVKCLCLLCRGEKARRSSMETLFFLFRKRQYSCHCAAAANKTLKNSFRKSQMRRDRKAQVRGDRIQLQFSPSLKIYLKVSKNFFLKVRILCWSRGPLAIFENKEKKIKSKNGERNERKRLKHLLNQMIVHYNSQPVCFFFLFFNLVSCIF